MKISVTEQKPRKQYFMRLTPSEAETFIGFGAINLRVRTRKTTEYMITVSRLSCQLEGKDLHNDMVIGLLLFDTDIPAIRYVLERALDRSIVYNPHHLRSMKRKLKHNLVQLVPEV